MKCAILRALVLVALVDVRVLHAQEGPSNKRLQPNVELLRRYQQRKHRRRRRMTGELDHLEERPDNTTFRRVTIQCSVEPLFRCTSCAQALQDEQGSVLSAIMEQYPQANLVSSSHKIANVLFVYLPLTQDDHAVDAFVNSLAGVLDIVPGEDYSRTVSDVVEYIGANAARETFCVTGRGVRVAVLDSGIDYTHAAIGGSGTVAAFESAFGTSLSSVENTQRDGLFPTERVVDGYDFLGDVLGDGAFAVEAQPDDDPIDLEGHGTAVASAILAVAPEADLVAVKVCVTDGLSCPDFAIIAGIEYALDPNGDGSTDDKVDVLNFSLGIPFTSAYYSPVSKALDDAFDLGVLSIVASGNDDNIPFNAGDLCKTVNAVAVGATGTSNRFTSGFGTNSVYSSRGPGENNSMKPDITAPAGFTMAKAGTGDGVFAAVGTSFSAPIVAGVAALLKERCPECSPLVIRTILMNNADPTVRYFENSDERAPVSLVGSGEVQVNKAVEADYYAYCVEDAQPSLSLGLIDAAADVVVRKTIRLVNLSSRAHLIRVSTSFRDQDDADSGAVAISFSRSALPLGAQCGSEVSIEVEFRITAALAPPNVMTSGGTAAEDFRRLDRHEFDGWVTLSSTEKDISLPFHMLLRQAADVSVANPTLPSIDGSPVNVPIGLVNNGAGVAQIDSYELIFTSEDDPENGRGSEDPPSDFRYIGYRVLPVFDTGCDYLLEFAITTWERTQKLNLDHFEIFIDIDGDFSPEVILFNAGPIFDSSTVECHLLNVETRDISCAGFVVDHSTNTANTILRVCSNDLNLSSDPQLLNIGVVTFSYPNVARSDATVLRGVQYPEPALAASSYDVLPGESLDDILVSRPTINGRQPASRGLLLITNAYRSSESTGAATQETEAVALLNQGFSDPQEVTPDVLVLPIAQNVNGPSFCSWEEIPLTCPSSPFSFQASVAALAESVNTNTSASIKTDPFRDPARRLQDEGGLNCRENPVPRSVPGALPPSPSPAPTGPTTERPTSSPTVSAMPSVSNSPTLVPTDASTSSGTRAFASNAAVVVVVAGLLLLLACFS